jgi:hypothetical protein
MGFLVAYEAVISALLGVGAGIAASLIIHYIIRRRS